MHWAFSIFMFMLLWVADDLIGKQAARIDKLESEVKMLNAKVGIANWKP